MPPKAPGSNTPQKKTSKPKQNIKTTQENVVEDRRQSLLEKEKETETSAQLHDSDLEESKSDIMDRFAQKKDFVLEQALVDVGIDASSFSEEGEEEESESDQSFGEMAHLSRFIKCDDISEEVEESEVLPLEQIEEEDTFFHTFGAVPEVDELSEDGSVKEEAKDPQRKASFTIGDKGKFVNPLTGQIVLPPDDRPVDITETISVKSEPVEEKRLSKRASKRLSKRPSIHDSTDKSEAVDEEESEEAHEDDDHQKFLLFLELETQREEAERALEGAAIDDLLRQEMERINYEQTMQFLKNLIDLCVDTAEYTDENVVLRKSLDKNKLMVELKTKLEVIESERKTVQFLNRKCAEFFRRRSAFSKMMSDYSAANHQKYCDVLKNLDDWLNKEKKFKKESVARLQECKEEYKIVSEKFENVVQRLEQLIMSTFHKEKFDSLKSVVFKKIEQMSTIRKEISADRTKLLILQHDATMLRQQLTKLENLGNGLFLKDYENLETETAALDKKVEERNTAVAKLYNHMNSDIHNLAHMKEKQKMMRHVISVQKQILNELQVEKKEIRKYITALKVRKNRNRNDIHQLSFHCGLLDKPVLMRDYDSTEISINKLRISNNDLKKNADNIVKKIAQLEDMNKRKNPKVSNESS